jgi:hypothetical protein
VLSEANLWRFHKADELQGVYSKAQLCVSLEEFIPATDGLGMTGSSQHVNNRRNTTPP